MTINITEVGILKIAESLDQQMTIDISARGSIRMLYEAARSLKEKPLTLSAVELFQKVITPGDYIMIATGWADQYWNVPYNGESDGPPGAVALARSLRMSMQALPIIVTDTYLVEGIKKIARGAGLHCVSPEDLKNSLDMSKGFACVPTVAVVPFPMGEQGKREAANLIQKWHPAVCLSIERGGMNEHGRIHGMGGIDFSEVQAKLDYLFIEAREKGIATIGIGDGGNEIGMANIAETIREKVPNGKKCKCPCGSGITPSTQVDILIPATISNWGAYALTCMIGLKTGMLDAMNDELIEDRVLTETANADFHDSIGARVRPSVDGCLAPIHMAIIRLMREIVFQGIKRYTNS